MPDPDQIYGTVNLTDLQKILQGLNLLGQDISNADDKGNPAQDPGSQALESLVTRTTKWFGGAVAALGGTSAVTAFIGKFWSSNSNAHTTILWGGSIVAAASAVGVAVIVAGDLLSRARGQAAIYDARREITVQFMKLAGPKPSPSPKADTATTGEAPKTDAPTPSPTDAASEPANTDGTAPTPLQSTLITAATTRQKGVIVITTGSKPGWGELDDISQMDKKVQLHVKSSDGSTNDWYPLEDVRLVKIIEPPDGSAAFAAVTPAPEVLGDGPT
jgi:hypothetical protein